MKYKLQKYFSGRHFHNPLISRRTAKLCNMNLIYLDEVWFVQTGRWKRKLNQRIWINVNVQQSINSVKTNLNLITGYLWSKHRDNTDITKFLSPQLTLNRDSWISNSVRWPKCSLLKVTHKIYLMIHTVSNIWLLATSSQKGFQRFSFYPFVNFM